METKTKKHLTEGLIAGKWQLTYKLINSLGAEAFSGKTIGPYRHPETGERVPLRTPMGDELVGFNITAPVMVFDPVNNPDDEVIVQWLVAHPAVGIDNDQCKLNQKVLSKKLSNPRIKLVNLDHQDVVDLEQEDYIDQLVGIITQDTGKKALGIDTLRFILAKLDLQYREEKLITNPAIEKPKLRRRLKKYVRTSYQNAERVNEIIDQIEDAKLTYQIKELLRTEIVTISGGTYMYQGNPIGISYESLKRHFDNHPDFYAQIISKLHEVQNNER